MEFAYHENWNQTPADHIFNGEIKENYFLGNLSVKTSHC